MIKLNYVILLLLFFISCDNSKTMIDKWDNGCKLVRIYPNKNDTTTYTREFYYSDLQLGTKGEIVNGKANGKWVWWYENGNKMDMAYFDNGRYIDTVFHWYSNGNIKTIELLYVKCEDNYCDSIYMNYDSLGILNSKEFINKGKIDSVIYYWNNGSVFKVIQFVNNKKNGKYYEYYANGNIWVKGNYVLDSMFGKWIWYDTLGTVNIIEDYD